MLFLVAGSIVSHAQLGLSGTTSPYTQNFDTIASGPPNGWVCYCASSNTSIGSIGHSNWTVGDGIYADTSTADGCAGAVFGGGFKNYASADACPGNATCAQQQTYTNRAIGVRQVSATNTTAPNLDSGAAFVLNLANTTSMYHLTMDFNLQSLDSVSSPRTTYWTVDYGIAASSSSYPTVFTPVSTTPSTLATGGYVWSNTPVSVDFGIALDNISTPVFIRIVTLVYSSGSGNRASTGIDDFKLNFSSTPTGVSTVNAAPEASLTAIGFATSDNVLLSYNIEVAGQYNFSVCDLSGRVITAQTMNITDRSDKIELSGLHLVPGMYIAKLANGNSSCFARIAVQ